MLKYPDSCVLIIDKYGKILALRGHILPHYRPIKFNVQVPPLHFYLQSIRRLPILKGETKMIKPITNMKDAFSLSGMNAVITGGNRGLGLGIATAMAQSGANIAILCRDKAKAAEAIAELQK